MSNIHKLIQAHFDDSRNLSEFSVYSPYDQSIHFQLTSLALAKPFILCEKISFSFHHKLTENKKQKFISITSALSVGLTIAIVTGTFPGTASKETVLQRTKKIIVKIKLSEFFIQFKKKKCHK